MHDAFWYFYCILEVKFANVTSGKAGYEKSVEKNDQSIEHSVLAIKKT